MQRGTQVGVGGDRWIAELAEGQHGLVSRRQLLAGGMERGAIMRAWSVASFTGYIGGYTRWDTGCSTWRGDGWRRFSLADRKQY
jgi:hypothetical protein